MDTVLTILREVGDPRSFNSRHDLPALLFIALAASLCVARTSVEFADFGEDNAADLAEIVDLAHGTPSHDCFSRVFRLLDPDEMEKALERFVAERSVPAWGWGRPEGRRRRAPITRSVSRATMVRSTTPRSGRSTP